MVLLPEQAAAAGVGDSVCWGCGEFRRGAIDSAVVDGLTSDAVLAALAPALVPLGYRVELGKRVVDRIRLPVLFGDGGRERVAYEVDAFQDDLGVVVEIEAGHAL